MTSLVVDASAVIAVLMDEPDASAYVDALFDHVGDSVMSAATRVELLIVGSARRTDGEEAVRSLLASFWIRVEPVDERLADAAFGAWQRFGKGRHAAGLNFGDCFSYALAQQHGVPLLYKGDDFAHTDVRSALA